jgi:DNA repair exonuclease SbcCD nuclease subunit
MANLFKRALVLTDVHFGLKSNSVVHNEDCKDFINWAISIAKQYNCETCLCLGDWHNNRASINILTLNYSLNALEALNDNFHKYSLFLAIMIFIIVINETFKVYNGLDIYQICNYVTIGLQKAML